jgi:hypothetical protein
LSGAESVAVRAQERQQTVRTAAAAAKKVVLKFSDGWFIDSSLKTKRSKSSSSFYILSITL